MRYQCPCCECFTLKEQPRTFEVCPVCYWMDDPLQFSDPNYVRPTNQLSLNEARSNFRSFGAIDKRYIDFVRKPLDHEINEP